MPSASVVIATAANPGCLRSVPQPVTDVLHCAQPRRDPDVAHMVAGERQVAQRAPRRRGRSEPARLQVLPLHLQVEPQLVVELAFVPIALEQVAQTPEQPGHPGLPEAVFTVHASLRASTGLILSARPAGPMQASRHAASITADVTPRYPA